MILLNPTGGTIRNDNKGAGFFRAQRRRKDSSIYLHRGVDFLLPLGPGQDIVSPISYNKARRVQVYRDTSEYTGWEMQNDEICIKLFYMIPNYILIDQFARQGEVIGTAQDISVRYPGMLPHVHMEIVWCSPLLLM